MASKNFLANFPEKKSLEEWVIKITMPILEAISFVTLELERQLQELN